MVLLVEKRSVYIKEQYSCHQFYNYGNTEYYDSAVRTRSEWQVLHHWSTARTHSAAALQ